MGEDVFKEDSITDCLLSGVNVGEMAEIAEELKQLMIKHNIDCITPSEYERGSIQIINGFIIIDAMEFRKA
jgi:hypothetical protein